MGFPDIIFILGFEKVVVRWITVREFVKEDGISWQSSPVLRRGGVSRVGSLRIIFSGVCSVLVDVQVIVDEVGAVWGCEDDGREAEKSMKRLWETHSLKGKREGNEGNRKGDNEVMVNRRGQNIVDFAVICTAKNNSCSVQRLLNGI